MRSTTTPMTVPSARQATLTPSVGAKGVGTVGEVLVPPDIWKEYARAPAGLSWVLANLPAQGETKDEGLEALAARM